MAGQGCKHAPARKENTFRQENTFKIDNPFHKDNTKESEKLNHRSNTIYEEFHPYIQNEIISKF